MDVLLGGDELLFFVPDVPAAKRWYGDLLGVYPYVDHGGYCAFRVALTRFGYVR